MTGTTRGAQDRERRRRSSGRRIATAPWLAIIPGVAIVLTVLSVNVFSDGLRDALDPRAKVRVEH